MVSAACNDKASTNVQRTYTVKRFVGFASPSSGLSHKYILARDHENVDTKWGHRLQFPLMHPTTVIAVSAVTGQVSSENWQSSQYVNDVCFCTLLCGEDGAVSSKDEVQEAEKVDDCMGET